MTDPAFREAYARHRDVLYRFAWRMTGSPAAAEDLVQDTFLLLLRNDIAFDPSRGALRSFLIGVTRNLALKRMRHDRGSEELHAESAICQPIDPDGRRRSEVIAQAIAALPPLQRDVLILAEYEELSLQEIAGIVHAELAAVKSRLHRARQNLRVLLAPLPGRTESATKGTFHGSRP